jgi:hypothetical protein
LAKIYHLRQSATLALHQRRSRLLSGLTIPQNLVRGSFVERYTTCGKVNCICVQGRKHGPFYYFVSGLARGRVLKFLLKSHAQQQVAQQGVSAYHNLWEQLEELSQINAELLRRDELFHTPNG